MKTEGMCYQVLSENVFKSCQLIPPTARSRKAFRLSLHNEVGGEALAFSSRAEGKAINPCDPYRGL